MAQFYLFIYQYYFIVLIIQGLCIWHVFKKGNQQSWIWIIIILPILGSIIYIFSEVIRKNDIQQIQSGVVDTVNPGRKVKQLEREFQFADTFANRLSLAEAYLERGMNQQAAELLEPALTDIFYDNEGGVAVLMQACYNLNQYEKVVTLAARIAKNVNFSKTRANLVYALSLEKSGKNELAEKQFEEMNHRYSNFEARYYYGCFLISTQQKAKAKTHFANVVAEADNMNWRERRGESSWISKCREELKKLNT